MKIFISHSNSFNFQEDLYEPIKKSDLFSQHDFFLPHDNGKIQNTKEQIKNSDLVIAEISYPSTGSGIEMGWANAFDIPIWCVYIENSKPSNSSQYIAEKTICYKDKENLVSILAQELK